MNFPPQQSLLIYKPTPASTSTSTSGVTWCDVFGCDDVLMATGVNTWICLLPIHGRWYAVGGSKDHPIQLVASGERQLSTLQAEAWFHQQVSTDSAAKTHHWLTRRASAQQLQRVSPLLRGKSDMTRYQTSALLHFQLNITEIVRLVKAANNAQREHA